MTLAQRCQLIKAMILDVDGVLTGGEIVYSESGQEIKAFHVRDGSAVKRWQKAGKVVAVLSGRNSAVTSLRARELGIELVEQGKADKGPGFQNLLQQLHCDAAQVAYVGDDIADLAIMRQVGFAVAPSDACAEAIETAHLVTRLPGGHGAVGEAIQWILSSQALWHVNPS